MVSDILVLVDDYKQFKKLISTIQHNCYNLDIQLTIYSGHRSVIVDIFTEEYRLTFVKKSQISKGAIRGCRYVGYCDAGFDSFDNKMILSYITNSYVNSFASVVIPNIIEELLTDQADIC